MELRLTLIDPQRAGRCVEVAVRAPAGTTLSAVADQLAVAVGRSAGPRQATAELQFDCEGARLSGSATLGLPPLLQGAVLALRPACPGDQVGSRPVPVDECLIEAHVVAGPDAGQVLPLTAGRHCVGRSSAGSIGIADPEVSREHAELLVEGPRITLRDRGSSAGTWLGDQPVDRVGVPLGLDREFRLGASRIAVRGPDRPPAALTLDGEGHLQVNRSPQLHPARPVREVRFPATPAQRPGIRFPWPALVLPLILALGMAVLWRQPGFAVFALMTPVMMIAQYLADRRSSSRAGNRGSARQQAAEQRSQATLDQAVEQDAAFLERERPDLARLAVTARTPTDELWRRSREAPGFLVLRLGRGSEAGAVLVHRPDDDATAGPRGQPIVHPDVPIAVNLGEIGILGVAGPRPAVLSMARSLVGQLAVLHSPEEVRITVVVAAQAHRGDWRWLRRLPHHLHTTADAGHPPAAERPATAQPTTLALESLAPCQVIVLDGAHALVRRPDVALALARAVADHGLSEQSGSARTRLICLDRTEQDLPAQCRGTVLLPAAPAPASGCEAPSTALLRREQTPATPFSPDLAGPRWAERLSRRLAPCQEAGPGRATGLPGSVRLIDLLAGHDVSDDDRVQPTDPADLARHWRREGGCPPPAAILGRSPGGAFRIDLRLDGPHLLIGGTTGAGKSELLQTLVASLAVGSAPDEVSFLLIDYKGGAAFRECAALPHVAGIITDLDQHLARRALASLTAELRRRERQLHSQRAGDIEAYSALRRLRAGGGSQHPVPPALPRLVVVVDEFRVLSEELPEFVSGLIRTATVGRSLGVHLVLATQRPAGIVSAEIRANVNLRIALRVRDRADSLDLIDDQAAALIPGDRPGRAWARSGAGPLTGFQTAQVSGRASSSAVQDQPRVFQLDPDDLDKRQDVARPPRPPDPGRLDVSDLSLIAGAAREAAALLRIEPAASPWQPALPEQITMPDVLSFPTGPGPAAPYPGHTRLPYGIVDLPAEQRQEVAAWLLGGSNLAIAGGPRSGRTSTLIALARAAAVASAARELHVYTLDTSGGLLGLRGLTNVDAAVSVHDMERSARLLRRLAHEVCERQRSAPDTPTTADVVLLLDGWEAIATAWNDVDHGRLLEELICLLRDGPAVGVVAAVSGGRALLTGNVSSLLTERLVLRFADKTDALLAGVSAAHLPDPQPPGRGVLLGPERPGGSEVQVAMTKGDVGADRPTGPPPFGRAGWRVPELPQRLEYRELPAAWRSGTTLGPAVGNRPDGPADAATTGSNHRWIVPIGIGGEDVTVLGLDLGESPVTLLLGAPGSGRTSTLRCIAAGLLKLDRPVVSICASHDEWWPTEAATPLLVIDGRRAQAPGQLARALSRYPQSTVLMDDVHPVAGRADGPAEQLGELLAVHTGELVVAARAPDVLAAYRGVLARARTTARAGLLLGAVAPGEGEALGVRLGRQPPGPPGRALLVRSGRVSTLQLALPPSRCAPQHRSGSAGGIDERLAFGR